MHISANSEASVVVDVLQVSMRVHTDARSTASPVQYLFEKLHVSAWVPALVALCAVHTYQCGCL